MGIKQRSKRSLPLKRRPSAGLKVRQPVLLPNNWLSSTVSWICVCADEEAVTLSFPLPEQLRVAPPPPKDIRVLFTPQFLNIHSPSHPALALSHRKLWAPIDTQLSTYSIDPDRLIVSLEKQHHSTTWPSVFDNSVTQDAENPTEEFSPQEINAMKDVLAHMTSEEPVVDNNNEPKASSTLLGDGMDRDELANSSDSLVRRQTLALDLQLEETMAKMSGPFDLLSTEAPVAGQPGRPRSAVVKRQVDGLLINSEWVHVATYPVSSSPPSFIPILRSN